MGESDLAGAGYTPDPKARWQAAMARIETMSREEWFEVIYGDGLKPILDELELLTKEYPSEAWSWLAEWWRTEPRCRGSWAGSGPVFSLGG